MSDSENRESRGHKHAGWIEVICGSMFQGKTEKLIRRLKRAEFAGLDTDLVLPGETDGY